MKRFAVLVCEYARRELSSRRWRYVEWPRDGLPPFAHPGADRGEICGFATVERLHEIWLPGLLVGGPLCSILEACRIFESIPATACDGLSCLGTCPHHGARQPHKEWSAGFRLCRFGAERF